MPRSISESSSGLSGVASSGSSLPLMRSSGGRVGFRWRSEAPFSVTNFGRGSSSIAWAGWAGGRRYCAGGRRGYNVAMPAAPAMRATPAFDLFPAPTARVLAVAHDGRLVRLDQLAADAHDPAGSAPSTGRAAEILARHHPGARHDPDAAPLPALRRQLAEYFAAQ